MTRGRAWENRIAWCMAWLIAGVTFAVYSSAARGATGTTILPLDDAYIHLQYARQIAEGQPFVYNPGEAPTSGATSLLYPFLLALGAVGGLRDLSLGVWSMIIGTIAFAVSIFLTYRTARLSAPWGYAMLIAAAFGLSGLFAWHAMSGMETMLATCFTLALLYGMASENRRWIVWSASLLAITRPEGAVGALLASGWLAWCWWRERREAGQRDAQLGAPPVAILFPLLAVGVQPLVNLVVTGSISATGGQAKSLLSAVAPMEVIIARIIDNFARMWREWLLPDGRYGAIIIPALAFIALIGMAWQAWTAERRAMHALPSTRQTNVPNDGGTGHPTGRLRTALSLRESRDGADGKNAVPTFVIGLLVVLWLVGTSALISTLDTAFWHFRRYQIPMMALFFPLAAWGAVMLESAVRGWARQWVRVGVALVLFVASAFVFALHPYWANIYALNVGYVDAQPRAMAAWLAENAPGDAVVAVHDVGMMRYEGGRTTFDMVGLTTPGAAPSWRQGPGALGELLIRARPDLIAAYGEGHGLGLNYLQDTDLYAETLASYSVWLDGENNVALAAATQGIYRPTWGSAERADLPRQASVRRYADSLGMRLIDSIDVADLADEEVHDYAWRSTGARLGFPTEFFQFDGLDCGDACTLADGGRRINAEESFTIHTQPGGALLLLTRVQAAHPGEFDIYADAVLVGTRVLPFLPGRWYELMTYIPLEQVDDETHIRIVPRLPEGDYMPYQHWIYQSDEPVIFAPADSPPLATYQEGRLSVNQIAVLRVRDRLDVTFTWMNGQPGEPRAQGDYLAFVHLYGDPDAPPVAQMDRRPANGTLPPGNWLPGMLNDTYMLDLSSVPPGRYRVAVGFYDPYTFARLQPTLTSAALPQFEVAPDGRLWVGEVVVGEDQ